MKVIKSISKTEVSKATANEDVRLVINAIEDLEPGGATIVIFDDDKELMRITASVRHYLPAGMLSVRKIDEDESGNLKYLLIRNEVEVDDRRPQEEPAPDEYHQDDGQYEPKPEDIRHAGEDPEQV